ncbi:MAG: hypothetical protein PHI40_05680, partial [Caldisericia bacterium]|nr:hypothetical protein [Caldisericia bacterium]
MKIVRYVMAFLLLFTMMHVPFGSLLADENNYAMVYFQHPHEISSYTQRNVDIEMIYADSILCQLTPSLEEYLDINEVFYRPLGDLTTFHFNEFIFTSNSKKDIVYPYPLSEE